MCRWETGGASFSSLLFLPLTVCLYHARVSVYTFDMLQVSSIVLSILLTIILIIASHAMDRLEYR